jgi:hypothetical protein
MTSPDVMHLQPTLLKSRQEFAKAHHYRHSTTTTRFILLATMFRTAITARASAFSAARSFHSTPRAAKTATEKAKDTLNDVGSSEIRNRRSCLPLCRPT